MTKSAGTAGLVTFTEEILNGKLYLFVFCQSTVRLVLDLGLVRPTRSSRKYDYKFERVWNVYVGTFRVWSGPIAEALKRRSIDTCCVQEV